MRIKISPCSGAEGTFSHVSPLMLPTLVLAQQKPLGRGAESAGDRPPAGQRKEPQGQRKGNQGSSSHTSSLG